MLGKKQPFISHTGTIDKDFQVIYYSDVDSKNLYPHRHDFFEMFMLMNGNIVYRTGGTDFFLRTGDTLFINKNQMHCPRLTNPSQLYERIVLQVSHETLRELSSDDIDLAECFTLDHFMVCHYPQEVQDNIRLTIGKLFEISEKDTFGSRLLGRAYLTELFVEINQYNHNKSIYSFDNKQKNSQLIELVKQYTLENIADEIRIKDLADYLYMSEFHLMHLFQRLFGITIYQMVLRTRLRATDKLILQGKSFTEASLQCGFGPYSNFYRAFVKAHNMSPREYYSGVLDRPSSKNKQDMQ